MINSIYILGFSQALVFSALTTAFFVSVVQIPSRSKAAGLYYTSKAYLTIFTCKRDK